MIGKRKSKSPANGLFLLVAFFSAVFLTSHLCWSKAQSQSWCKFPMQESNPKKLGPMDFYAGYLGFIAPAKKERKCWCTANSLIADSWALPFMMKILCSLIPLLTIR